MADTIRGITIEIGGDTSKLSKALGSVNSTIRSTQSQLKDVNKLLKFDPGNADLLAQKQRLLGEAITETSKKLETLRTASKAAEEQLAVDPKAQASYDAIQREIVATEAELKKLEAQAKATSPALINIAEAGKKLEAAGDKIKGVGQALTPISAGAAAIGTIGVKSAADFQQAMSDLAATMGKTNEDIATTNYTVGDFSGTLGDFAQKMGAETAFSAKEAAEGLNILAMAGLSATDQIAALPTVLNLAAAGGMDLSTSASYVSGAVKGFGDGMENAAYYADLMAKGATLANTDVSGLGEALGNSAATAKSYGQSADSVTLSLLKLAEQNKTGSEAATMLNRAMADLYTPTDAASKALQELGISAYDFNGDARDFNTVVDEITSALSGMSQEEANAYKSTIFTTNGLKAFNMMASTTTERSAEMWAGISGANGSAAEQAATKLDNLNGRITLLKSAFEGIMISIGNALMPMIEALVGKLQALADWFNGLSEGQQKFAAAVLVLVAALAPVLVVIGTVVEKVGILMQYIPTLITLISGISAPVLAVIAVITGVVAALALLYKHNEDFRNKVNVIWEQIKTTIETIINAVQTIIQMFVNAVTMLWNKWGADIMALVDKAFNIIFSVISTKLTNVQNVITTILSAVQAFWDTWGNTILTVTDTIFNAVLSVINTILNAIQAVWTAVLQVLQGDWQGAWNTISTFASETLANIYAGVSEKIGQVKDIIVEKVGDAVNFLKELPGKALEWGRDLIDNFIDGIKDSIGKIGDVLSDVADEVTDFLGFSEPDKGPLSKFHTFAPDMVDLFAKGIADNAYKITDQMQGLTAAMAGTMQASRVANLTVNSNLTMNGRVLATAVNRELGVML